MTDLTATSLCQTSPGALLPRLLSMVVGLASQAHLTATNGALSDDARVAADIEDVLAAQNGDHDAFERIVRRYQQEVARRLRRFSANVGVIEELTQETFVQAYSSLGRFRGDAPLLHWLHRIAVRCGYRYWTDKRRHDHTHQIDPDRAATTAVPADHRVDRLTQVLATLAPRDRLVLTLLYLEGYTVAQTAALTGWSRAMVKVQAFRARARLRKLMELSAAGGQP